jgi:hypothetical protein
VLRLFKAHIYHPELFIDTLKDTQTVTHLTPGALRPSVENYHPALLLFGCACCFRPTFETCIIYRDRRAILFIRGVFIHGSTTAEAQVASSLSR